MPPTAWITKLASSPNQNLSSIVASRVAGKTPDMRCRNGARRGSEHCLMARPSVILRRRKGSSRAKTGKNLRVACSFGPFIVKANPRCASALDSAQYCRWPIIGVHYTVATRQAARSNRTIIHDRNCQNSTCLWSDCVTHCIVSPVTATVVNG
jgi:hypothetical protein